MPMTTDLPVGDLFEFIGDFRLNGDGPPTTGRMGLDRLQAILLGSTSIVGARIAVIESRLATAEGYTNQITGLATRVTTLEGLAGISPGTDLAADGTAVRSTRYWPRPGEAIRTWTNATNIAAASAAPLTVGGPYSITTDGPGKGPALRITGNAYATSIAKTHLDDGEIVEFTFRIARRVDNTGTNAAANNVPVLEFRCYKADGTDNGTVSLPTTALLAADGLRTITYRASLIPGVGSVDLPANTRFISPLFGERGNGAVELVSADRGVQSLAAAPVKTTIADTDLIASYSANGRIPSLSSFADLVKQLEAALAPPRLYQHEIRGLVVSNESSVVLSADDLRRGEIEIQALTQCQLGVRFGGGPAVFGESGTWLQSSDWLNHNGGQGSCSIVARAKEGDAPTAPFSVIINIRVNRTVNIPPNALTQGDIVVGRMKDPMDPRYAAIIKKEVDDSVALGDYPKFPLWALIGSTKENCRVNIGNPNGKLFTFREGSSGTPIQITPYLRLQGNGQDQNIDSGYFPADVGWTDASHALAARAGSTVTLGGPNPQIASDRINVQPNRTNGEHGFQSGAASDRVTLAGSNGKWVGFSRISTGSLRTFIDEAFSTEFVRANPTVVPRTIRLMSGAGVAGNSDYSLAPFAGAFTGPGCTDAEFIRQVQRVKRIEAVGALIASGA